MKSLKSVFVLTTALSLSTFLASCSSSKTNNQISKTESQDSNKIATPEKESATTTNQENPNQNLSTETKEAIANEGIVENDLALQPERDNTPRANNPTGPVVDTITYDSLSEAKKYRLDMDAYIDAVDSALNIDVPLEPTEDYDEKADLLNLPRFREAYLRNFSYYDEDGLVLNPIKSPVKIAHWKAVLFNGGKSRYLANDLYKKAALQTFSIQITNTNSEGDQPIHTSSFGTAWILDFKPTEDGSYPTTWYIATNLHVAEKIVKNQPDENTNYSNYVDPRAQSQELLNLENQIKIARKKWDQAFEPFKVQIDDHEKRIADLERISRTRDLISSEKRKLEELKNNLDQLNRQYPVALKNELIEWNKWNDKIKEFEKNSTFPTSSVVLHKFSDETPLEQQLEFTSYANTVHRFRFEPKNIKLIYAANDFLKTSPKSYLASNSKFKDLEEMADFAVLEVKFDDIKNYTAQTDRNVAQSFSDDPQAIAALATSNYANNTDNHIKFPTKSIDRIYEKVKSEQVEVNYNDNLISVPKIDVNFIAVGFPNGKFDYLLGKYDIPWKYPSHAHIENTTSLWTNKPRDLKPFTHDFGNGLSNGLAFRTFADKHGLTDILISQPLIDSENNQAFSINNVKDKTSPYQGNQYLYYGLGINPSSWAPFNGASGSSFRDINNTIYGINYATGDNSGSTGTSFVQALRSDGINYKGFYGNYNLEQYDLIYGGGKNQRTSFREAILAAYGSEYKTNLFKNGPAEIPSAYLF
ncbi:Ig-specific serine endopeptidase MIP [Mycoplasma sp. Ms02]|uniref:Ig-specific serine endopeptidase MIP n=1 Tax=Mycoplasma sp. Ms02 TaxID=353851 RepID=UPI001C892BA4|nr:DUF31 family protein [Mycoplasma sp. Ms02]QZE12329.1 DUF31 family protein [Mycoplasma sp. Ms02]